MNFEVLDRIQPAPFTKLTSQPDYVSCHPAQNVPYLSGTERVDDYWHRGRTLEGGSEGTFPPSYCWEPDPSNYVTALKSRKHRVEKFAKVLHSMKAQLDGEIDLVEGDIVREDRYSVLL